MQIKRYLALMP